MSLRSSVLLAILLHMILLLCLTKIVWPEHKLINKKSGWQDTIIIHSYLYAPKQVAAVTQDKAKSVIHQVKQAPMKLPKAVVMNNAKPDNPNKVINNRASANLTHGEYNHLLIVLHNAIAKKQVYPSNAQLLGQRGTVTVGFHLQTSGRITDIRIEKSSGFVLLDKAAVAAIRAINPFTAVKIEKNLMLTIQIQFNK